MKVLFISVVVLLAGWLTPTASGQTADRSLTTTWHRTPESGQRLVRLHNEFVRRGETSCHSSRASLLIKTLEEGGPDAFRRPDVRAKITAIRKQMTRAEKKEAARQYRIEANFRKYQEQLARKEQRIALR